MAAIHDWNHNYSLARILSCSAGVVSKDSAFFHPFPIAPVEVHVGSADASSRKLYQHPVAFNLGFGDVFDFDVVWSTVNSSFQKESTLIVESSLVGY